MGTPKATAPDRLSALSVGANTIRPCAQKTQHPQPRVPYVAGNTQRVTKDVLYTKIYTKHGVKPITQYTKLLFGLLLLQSTSTMPVNSPLLPRNRHPFPAPEPSSSSYSRIVTHHQQPINTTEQLSIFLDEFKTMFSQLIQQNGMILNMIRTVIQKLTN